MLSTNFPINWLTVEDWGSVDLEELSDPVLIQAEIGHVRCLEFGQPGGKDLPKGSKLPPVPHGNLRQAHESGSLQEMG